MSKKDYEIGSSTISGFFGWINERQAIWRRRFVEKLPKPWTQDEIMQRYKFTNCFRQLDRGTIALQKMIAPLIKELVAVRKVGILNMSAKQRALHDELEHLLCFNIMWYRLFNLDTHAERLGYVRNFEALADYMKKSWDRGDKIFTSAHMTTGVAFEDKVDTYLQASEEAWNECRVVVQACRELNTIKGAYDTLLQFYMIGHFVAYEMACDLRFTPLLEKCTDKLLWANIGPGAARGMERLGLFVSSDTMVALHRLAIGDGHLIDSVCKIPEATAIILDEARKAGCRVSPHVLNAPCPFEVREIEHSLCEFDKYERTRLGQGKPRQKYNGENDD